MIVLTILTILLDALNWTCHILFGKILNGNLSYGVI